MTHANPTKADIAAVFKRLKSVSTNNKCFDCDAVNPTWASVTYGVFLCIDCSAVHRSLGVHITFIRSIQLDTSWTWLQLRAMQIGGNHNARQFFTHHGGWHMDAHVKYKGRAAQLYREKLHISAMKALKQHTRLHLDSFHGDSNTAEEPSSPNFFTEDHSVGSFPTGSVANNNNNDTKLTAASSLSSTEVSSNGVEASGDQPGPNIEAALSTSPKQASKMMQSHKPTIGGRPAAAKKGLGGVKKGGLGAQKVKKDFAEVENAAKEMEKMNAAAPRVTKTPQEEEKEIISRNLAYKELISTQPSTEINRPMNKNKKEQIERLGMGATGARTVSHSATQDMQCIDQETPTNARGTFKLDRVMLKGYGADPDETEIVDNIRSFQINSNSFFDAYDDNFDSWNSKKTSSSSSSYKNQVTSSYDDDADKRKKNVVHDVSTSDVVQKKYGNAKAISSDMYFGSNRDESYEVRRNLQKFEGSQGISSNDFFGKTPQNQGASYNVVTPDLQDIKDGVKQGITKVAGRLSNFANDMMSSMQK